MRHSVTLRRIMRYLVPLVFLLPIVASATYQERPVLAINIPTVQLTNYSVNDAAGQRTMDVPWIAQYASGVYSYAVTIAGLLAGVMIVVGGFQYLTAGGDTNRISKAKDRIKDALIGLFLVFGAYLILTTVNPSLVSLETLRIKTVKQIRFVANETPASETSVPSAVLPPGAPTGPLTPTAIRHFAQCGSVGRATAYTDRGRCPTRPDGTNFTLCSSGCGVASTAMVLGSVTGRDPSQLATELAALSSSAGCRPCNPDCSDCSGTDLNCLVRSSNMSRYGVTGRSVSGRANIDTELRAGRPLVALYRRSVFTGGGHYVVIAGINPDGTYRVLDPGKNQSPYNYSCEAVRRSSATATCPVSSDRMPAELIYGSGLSGTWAIQAR